MKLIVVSARLNALEALQFRNSFADLFDGLFVYAGFYRRGGYCTPEHCFHVVRIPEETELPNRCHEMHLEPGLVLRRPRAPRKDVRKKVLTLTR